MKCQTDMTKSNRLCDQQEGEYKQTNVAMQELTGPRMGNASSDKC